MLTHVFMWITPEESITGIIRLNIALIFLLNTILVKWRLHLNFIKKNNIHNSSKSPPTNVANDNVWPGVLKKSKNKSAIIETILSMAGAIANGRNLLKEFKMPP